MKCSLILLLLTLGFTLSKEPAFPGGEKVIPHLAQKLTSTECWILGNYLAQKAPKPSHAQAKMAKVGGHAKDFDCLAGLNLWASKLIPYKTEKKKIYVKKELYQALRFAGRQDLRDWLKAFDFEAESEPLAVSQKPDPAPEVWKSIETTLEPAGRAISEPLRRNPPMLRIQILGSGIIRPGLANNATKVWKMEELLEGTTEDRRDVEHRRITRNAIQHLKQLIRWLVVSCILSLALFIGITLVVIRRSPEDDPVRDYEPQVMIRVRNTVSAVCQTEPCPAAAEASNDTMDENEDESEEDTDSDGATSPAAVSTPTTNTGNQ